MRASGSFFSRMFKFLLFGPWKNGEAAEEALDV